MEQDPYKILGLNKSASQAEIKKAYRSIAKKTHPDLHPGDASAEAQFKAASAAHDLLGDSEKRGRFDRGEIDASGAEKPDRQFYRDFAEAPGHSYQSNRGFEDFGNASDVFAEILRQRGGTAGGGFDARGADMRYALSLDFLEAAGGTKKKITLPDGQKLEIKIPEATADGQTIRLRGKGGPGFGKGPAGDALVTVTVQPHKDFSREDQNIKVVLPISISEAILGGKVETPTIDGVVHLNIPSGASSGQILRLRGRGLKAKNSKERGDQLVELKIIAPPLVDDELKNFMQSWQDSHAYNPRVKGTK